MGVGETGAVNGAKPQAQADKKPSAESVKDFNAARAQAATSNGGKPTIVRIDATYRSKSATATLSDGSKVPLTLTKNQLAPGDTLHNLEYGAESGPEDSPVVELTSDNGASNSILWQQPANYGLSPKVVVSIKRDPDEAARQKLERLPPYIREHVKQVGGGESLEAQAKMGEDLVKSGAKKEDFAPIEMQGKAPADPDFKFVESARKGMWSQFPSFDQFKKDLTRQVETAKAEARTKGLNPPDPLEGAEWKDNPAAAKEKWDKFVHAEYDKALKKEAAGLRYVGEYASMAENAIYQAWGLSAAVGTGAAGLAAAGEALALPTLLQTSTGISTAKWFGLYGTYELGTTFGTNLIDRGKEGIAAGSNPISIISTAATDTVGGKVVEKITNKSNLTGEDLKLSTEQRVLGGVTEAVGAGFNILGVHQYVKAPVPDIPVPGRNSAGSTVNDAPTSTQKQLSSGSSSADDVAVSTGKATATAGGDTATTVKTSVVNDAPATNTARGKTGEVTAPGTAKPATASAGGDAGDTMRMRKPGSGEASKPTDTTNVSGSKTAETARDIPDAGDTVKMRKADAADAPKAEAGAGGAAGVKAGAGAAPAVPTKSVDQIVDAYTRGRTPGEIRSSVSEGDIARMKERFRSELRNSKQDPGLADQISDTQYRRMAMAEDVYGHYNQPSVGKPQPKISQAQLDAQLKKYDGPMESPDGWHVRMNKSPPGTTPDNSWVKADAAHPVDRFYVNVKGDHAAEFADHVAGELNKKGIKFQLKVASEVDGYARADSALVYTQGKDFEAVRDVLSKYRDTHPAAIAEGSPAFTKPMGKGIAVAEEPLQEGLPLVYHGGHSFGTARANVIAEAINQAPANASPGQVKAYVHSKLQQAGFDVDRPWLSQGSKVDRFNVDDANVARSNAPNSAAFADTMPQPAVRANPQSPPGQGGPGGNQGASGGAAGGGSNGSGGTGASSADIADQAAARQHAEQVRNYKPNFKANPNQGQSVAIDSLLDDMQKGKLKVVDNAFNSKFHDEVWQDLTGKQGQAPAAYTIGDQARVDLNRLTPEQLRSYRAYVQKQDAAKGPH